MLLRRPYSVQVEVQAFSGGTSLAPPVRTLFATLCPRCEFDQDIFLAVKICDLPLDTVLVVTLVGLCGLGEVGTRGC